MRLIIIAVLVLLALFILGSAIFRKRGNGISWLLIIIILVPAGVAGWFEWRWQQEVKYISEEIVAKISGNPDAKLDCQRLTFAVGDAESSEHLFDAGENTIGMKYSQCALILDYYRNTDTPKPAPTLEQAGAINLLTSESVKLSGQETDPVKITCLGNRNLGFAVAALGGTERQGNLVAYTYQEEVLNKDKSGKFKSLQCFRI